MKKILLICVVIVIALGMLSCSNHKHDNIGKLVTVKEATCLSEGKANLICTGCGEVISSVILPKSDTHHPIYSSSKAATCSETGLTQGKYCSWCREIIIPQYTIPMLAHTYDSKHDVDCNECGHVRNPECTHTGIEILEGSEPTCEKIGLTEGKYCPGCDEIIEAQEIIDSLGHEMGEWFICADENHPEGIGTRKCIRDDCGLTEYHEVSMGLEYSANGNGECTIVGLGTCMDEDIFIPASIDGYTVTRIGSLVMKIEIREQIEQIKSVVIPNTVSYIEPYAFETCYLMENIYIPSSVTNIGEFAFAHCDSLESIDVDPDNQMYKSIDGSLYTKDGTMLLYYPMRKTEESIVIPDGVKIINTMFFSYDSHLIKISIPASVQKIHPLAFYDCYSLVSIEVDSNNEYFKSVDGTLYTKDGKILLKHPEGRMDKSFIIPDGVEIIAQGAFIYDFNLTSISIPESVIVIELDAFWNCYNLKSVKIPSSVQHIGSGAFSACHGLESIEVDINNQNYKSIDGNLYTKDGTVLIQYGTAKKDKSFVIPNGVVVIAERAFMGNEHLVSVTIPNSVCDIGDCAFQGCTSLTNIVLPDSLTEIKDRVFWRCESLKSINIPRSVTSIGHHAFGECKSLQTIVIPNSVQYIWEYAFEGCDSLTIYCEHEEEPLYWNDWEWNPDNRPVVWGY